MSIPGLSSATHAASLTATAPAAAASGPSGASPGAQLSSVVAVVSEGIPGSPFTPQVRVSPDSLVATPQIPPLLFDSQAESVSGAAVGSLIDAKA